ncbi:MAG: FAD-binding oxidoreductase [Chitinophagaceae bacterium]|nr:FAD-binding oxidoreductase [Chitinophagaceae bacterium]
MQVNSIDSLKSKFAGRIIVPADPDYEDARKVHNGMIDKRPSLIAYCKDVNDVRSAVNFARENNIVLAVRCGGHNAAGFGVCDNGMVIDLSALKAIHVDSEAKTARVGGGCLLKEVDAATHEVGMAVPLGFFGGTGVGGLALGGGLGYLTRQYGLTIDNLLEADVVLASGELVRASATEHSDLLWALKGGGGNFGVVVSFLFRLNPVHTIYGGLMLWDWEESAEIMQWYDKLMSSASNDLYGFFGLLIVPPADPFPIHLHNKKVCGIVWCYNGDTKLADEVFAPIRSYKKSVLDFVGPMPFTAIQTMFDAMYPPGLQWYWKALFIKDLNKDSIDLFIRHGSDMPTVLSTMHIYPVNGVAAQVKDDDTAWNFRDARYVVVILGIDPDPSARELIKNWTRDYWNALQPYSLGGAYVNFIMDEGLESVKSNYGKNYKRLSAVKAKYDPENFFRVNQNINPA